MRKKEQIRDLLVKALRLLNNKDDGSWHLYYRAELEHDKPEEVLYKITAFLESPDSFTIESQPIIVSVNENWQLSMEGLLLCLNLYMQQPVMPVDDPLTIHTSYDKAYAFLAEAQLRTLDLDVFLKSKNLDKITEKVATGFVFLVNLLPEVNLELE